MDRLLHIQHHFISNQPNFFQDYLSKSTIEGEELKQIFYGPNFKERERAMSIVKDNPDQFEHFHLT